MPLINVRLIENVFTREQKQQMARDLSGDWAIGGRPVTPEAVHARGDLSLPV
jgi:phenylpyruvate tautomerase PptA (4-oxalocrotonate tautomerase family)